MDVHGAKKIIAEALRDRFAAEFSCDRSMTARARMAEQWADGVLEALEAEGIVLYRECDDCGGSGVRIREGTPWPICKALGLPPDHDEVECPTCAGAGYFPLESLPESEK